MPRYLDPQTLPRSGGQASQGVLVGSAFKRLLSTPQAGMQANGTLRDGGLEAQLEQAFDNVLALLSGAGLDVRDLVHLSIFSKVPGSAAVCNRVRDRKITPARPASAYREVAGFAHPDCLVEVEFEAVREG
jgi:2-iminobutanoate/2-iminopropanoate deaminase